MPSIQADLEFETIKELFYIEKVGKKKKRFSVELTVPAAVLDERYVFAFVRERPKSHT